MADIILRSAKGSNLTPSELDFNFKSLNQALITLQVTAGSGTVSSVAVNNQLGGVLDVDITGLPSVNPTIRFRVTGSSGYVKSNGTSLSTSASIPFSDTTGTVPVNRGGTNLSTVGSSNTFLSSNGSDLVYRSLSSSDGSVGLSFGSYTLDLTINESALDITAMTGVLPVNRGGTGNTTAQAAINILTNVTSASTGQILQKDSFGNVSWVTPNIGTGTVTSFSYYTSGLSSVFNFGVSSPTTTPTLIITVTGSAGYLYSDGTLLSTISSIPLSDISGTVPISKGGTGEISRQAAIDSLTDVSTVAVNSIFYKDSSGKTAWTLSPVVSDISITNQRVIASTTTLDPTDYFVGIDSATAFAIDLPDTTDLPAGKRIIVKDVKGSSNINHCTINAYAGGNPPAAIDGVLGGSVSLNQKYGSVEFILLEDSGVKNWFIKSTYKIT